MTNVEELYASAIRDMPVDERRHLATLILKDLPQSDQRVLDYDDEWTEEDMRDLTAYSMKIAEERYPYEDDLC